MSEIKRAELSEEWAHSGIVEAGGYIFISYCMENEGQSVENEASPRQAAGNFQFKTKNSLHYTRGCALSERSESKGSAGGI